MACYDMNTSPGGKGRDVATYTEARKHIGYLAKSCDNMTIAYNIQDVRSDHMPDVFTPDEALIVIDTINRIAAEVGKPVSFTIYRVENW